MSAIRVALRSLVLFAFTFVLCTCAKYDQPTVVPPGATASGNPCTAGTGSGDRNAPIVCVDDTGPTLSVRPDPITVNDVGRTDAKPVMIHWFTRSGANALHIDMRSGCVTTPSCSGGHCTALTLPMDGSDVRCKYDVWTDKHPRLDPTIIVTDCC